MLDRTKLLHALETLTPKLFPNYDDEFVIARKVWKQISQDPCFAALALAAEGGCLIPRWCDNLSDSFKIEHEQLEPYAVLTVDGSQIYPDRHVGGAGCFLINTGSALLSYGMQSYARLESEPYVLVPNDVADLEQGISFSVELIDLLREAYELETMHRQAKKMETPPVCLVDGSLIFWHLEGKEPEVKNYFLLRYMRALDACYKDDILVAGYISFPKSRELVNLVKLGLCQFGNAPCMPCPATAQTTECKQIYNLIDTHVASFFLEPWHRTTLFASRSKIIEEYPEHLKPHFFYVNVAQEIVRIEVPQWIAQSPERLAKICSVIVDQTKKGFGYPVVLAEAHEQAVVKGADRDFFYHLLCRIGIDAQKTVVISQKSAKKRQMGI